jgi:hypothetical protein
VTKSSCDMAQEHTLKPKKINSIWQEVAAERRGSGIGYDQTEVDAIPTDLSEDAQIRARTLNFVILDTSDPKPLKLPQKFESILETTPEAFFASTAQTLDELSASVEAFGRDYLQPNHALINARQEVQRLENEL